MPLTSPGSNWKKALRGVKDIQVVFAVEWRQALIKPENKEELHKYITGIVRNKGQKMIAINSRPDHLHMLVGMKLDIALSDLAVIQG